uniref:Uncharacterized protein n=1 Tax=Romanomermis culicivorax TaxID=13658 RepID=A0A915JQ79_ROMCU
MEAGRALWSKPTESEVPAGTYDLYSNRPQNSGRHDLSDKSRLPDTRTWPEIITVDENSEKFDQPREGNLYRNSNSACIDHEEDPAHDQNDTLKDQERLKMNEIRKAVQAGDLSRAKEIMQAKEVKQAKWIREEVSWDEEKLGNWPKFAYNHLFKANTL